MGRRIVLAGGGHAHMTVLLRSHVFRERGHTVTLVSPSTHHYYSGMGPGMLSGTYHPREIRFHIRKMIEDRHGTFLQDKIIRIDPEEKTLALQSGGSVRYDIVSFNVGSDVPTHFPEEKGRNVFSVKPIVNLLKARELIQDWPTDKAIRIVVIGGGPAGTEIAGNVSTLTATRTAETDIILVAGRRLLESFPPKARTIAKKSLSMRGVEVIEGTRAENIEDRKVRLGDGRSFRYDIVLLASGVKPPSLFQDSGIPTDRDGGMVVNQHLQSVSHPEIFGGGDCVSLEGRRLEKVGVYAVRQNPVLYHNLLSLAEGKDLRSFDPGGRYLLILNMGDGRGIFWRGSLVWDGRFAFLLKDYIDRRFMKRFQVSGERGEK